MGINQISGSVSALAPEHRLDTVYTRDIAGIIDIAASEELQSVSTTAEEIEFDQLLGEQAALVGASQYVTYNFKAGWNMIGSVLPYAQNIRDTFADIEDKVALIKDNAADVYLPEFSFNGIGDFLPGQGYQVKMLEPVQFTIPLFGANLAINTQIVQNRQLLWHNSLYEHGYINFLEGWNIISFNRKTPQNAVDAFANGTADGEPLNLSPVIQIVKDNAGTVYMPEFDFNGIGDLIPGQGYQVKMSTAIYKFRWPSDIFDDSSLFVNPGIL